MLKPFAGTVPCKLGTAGSSQNNPLAEGQFPRNPLAELRQAPRAFHPGGRLLADLPDRVPKPFG